MIKIAVLTISSTKTKETDLSGKRILELLNTDIYTIVGADIVIDNKEKIINKLKYYIDEVNTDIVLTTGGTGLGPYDVTPEATLEVIEKKVPGISELIRMEGLKKTKRSILSRGICGTKDGTLIINLPGSPNGAVESLQAILDLIPHAIDMISGKGH